MMTTSLSDGFDAWKQDPEGFFRHHRKLFGHLIRKHGFYGHLNCHQFEGTVALIALRMTEQPAVRRLNGYAGTIPFLLYYIKILQREVVNLSQAEDVDLLKNSPNTLILKYQPLMSFIISKVLASRNSSNDLKFDLEQEVILDLMNKADYINEYYQDTMLFRNYIWSIIYNSLLNQLKSRKWKNHRVLQFPPAVYAFDETDYDRVFYIDAGFKRLNEILFSYKNDRIKLEVCLKVIFSLPCTCFDLKALFSPGNSSLSTPELMQLCLELNEKTKAAGYSQSQRFAIISPLLNRAFGAKALHESYLHWTNDQIQHMISKLNNGKQQRFNRETFAILAEMYFMKFYGGHAPNEHALVVDSY